MSKYIYLVFIALVFFSISSCDNKIEINAPYKEIPIVYAMIDVDEDQHYVRIEKAFQNSDDVSSAQITQIADSLYFDTLVVKLYDVNNPSKFVYLDRYDGNTFPKDSGVFTTKRNTLYTTLTLPITSGTLGLEIYNPKSGKTYNATTPLISGGDFTGFGAQTVSINESDARYIQYTFNKGANAYMYDMFVRLHYKEMNTADTNISVDKNADFYFEKGYLTSNFVQYRNVSYNKITWKQFLQFLPVALAKDDTKIRRVIYLAYAAYGGTKEFAELQELSRPVIGFIQRNSEYSNISNGGLGIFTSRNLRLEDKSLSDSSLYFIGKYGPSFVKF